MGPCVQVELHFHLLPGVDDGPRDLAATLDLARAALADGTSTVVVTPHVRDVRVADLPALVHDLSCGLAAAGLPLRVVRGGELAVADLPDVPDLDVFAVGPAGRRWMLLEATLGVATRDFARAVAEMQQAADDLRACGYGVVLAHPERSEALFADGGGALSRQIEAGAVPQVSAPSLLGAYGDAVRARALGLLRAPGAVIASDAHSVDARPPSLRAAEAWLRAIGRPAGEVEAFIRRRPHALLAEGFPVAGRP
jgi:protein-tyrosine phosphatase